jgi:hypothetical protein
VTLAFRRTVLLDGERPPDDYGVVQEGRTVGRILRMNSTALEKSLRTQIGWGLVGRPERGVADSLDEAMAAFSGGGRAQR